MTHHMTEGVGLEWMRGAAIAFLIRDPRSVAASYAAKREDITAADIGHARQAEIFDIVANMRGTPPPVVDAADVRAAHKAVLRKLCAALALAWDPAMLSWPAGPQPSDGIWGRHWYAAVNASTRFAPPEGGLPILPALIENVAAEARPHYERLARYRLLPDLDEEHVLRSGD